MEDVDQELPGTSQGTDPRNRKEPQVGGGVGGGVEKK